MTKFLGGFLFIAVAIGVLFLWLGIGFLFLILLGLCVLAWALGTPIDMTENGVKIGYIKWTKFYPYE